MNETLKAVRVLGFWRVVYYRTLYRPLMRTAHRFHWCYMAPKPQIERDWQRFKCEWCGASKQHYVGPGLKFKDEGAAVMTGAAQP